MQIPALKRPQIRLRPAMVVVGLVFLSGCGSTIVQSQPTVAQSGGRAPSAAPSGGQPPSTPPPSVPPSPAQPPTSSQQATAQPTDGQSGQPLSIDVTEPGAFVHLEALQRIADENGGNRASPCPGYDASVDYVTGVLREAGYNVSTPTYDGSGEESDEEEHSEEGNNEAAAPLRNVIAQTRTGDPAAVVMIGAHLDSVPDGPGIVDDGSGVAALLEIATRLGGSPQTRNAVRFAFFGSEEEGAVGSTAYVESLTAEERQNIMLYLNVDMIASPNAGYLVQGGKGADLSAAGPPGSGAIAAVMVDELAKTGVNAEIIEFVGDDEAPFVEAGIPSGGAENGDQQSPTAQQAQTWGGQAGQPFDRCYHTACDRLDNVNRAVLQHYLHALAGTLAHFAMSTERPS